MAIELVSQQSAICVMIYRREWATGKEGGPKVRLRSKDLRVYTTILHRATKETASATDAGHALLPLPFTHVRFGHLRGWRLQLLIFYVLYLTLLHLPPPRFHCVIGCWDRTQDCCAYGIVSQTL
jgi:hypothetical protein